MAKLAEDDLQGFYDDCYRPDADPQGAERSRRWRELSAIGKSDHVESLVRDAGLGTGGTWAEVGCGDGAVLAELARRGLGDRHVGLEISAPGVELTASRPEIDEALLFDGTKLPAEDGAWSVAFATHVFEHIPDPRPLLAEMARVADALVIEVPLENNLSARRPAGRAASESVGHLQRFDRRQMHELIDGAGLRVRGELSDPLPREVHTFWAGSRRARAQGTVKWALRRVLASVPAVGERAVTMHYALLATR